MSDTTTNRDRQPSADRLGPLLNQHVKTILESGLLLDEDYEVLLSASNFKLYPGETGRLSLRIVLGSLATIGSLVVAFKIKRPSVLIPSAVASILLFYFKKKAQLRQARRENVVPELVQNLLKLRRLNFSVIRYLKMREDQPQDGILAFNDHVKQFLQTFLNYNQKYLKECLCYIALLAVKTPDLQEDFESLKDFDPESILASECTDETYQQLCQTVQDIYTILGSKYLNYLGLAFADSLKEPYIGIDDLLDHDISAFKALTNQHIVQVQQEFNNLRYSASKKLEIYGTKKGAFTQKLSGKLQQTLNATINKLSLIMEQSRTVLGKIEDVQDDKDIKKLEVALKDLRDQALGTYESLDVLCKLFGILSEANKQEVKPFQPTTIEAGKSDAPTVNFDDPNDALEENFELYIPEGAEQDTSEDKVSFDDQAGMYLSLMVKELKQSLKQHERFIAARDKRGVIEEDEEESKEQTKSEDSHVPKFNLKNFNENVPVPAPRASKLPPPPPPPLPTECIDDSEDVFVSESKKSLFESIRTLSNQLQRTEDVFGSEGSSESDC